MDDLMNRPASAGPLVVFGAKPFAKADGHALVKKSDDPGDSFSGMPLVVFSGQMAQAADLDAGAAAAPEAAPPAEAPGPVQPEEAAPPAVQPDPRGTYVQRVVMALRNFWNPK